MRIIDSFTGKYFFLSNFYMSPVILPEDSQTYKSVEHAFQAAKTLNRDYRGVIADQPTPGLAKAKGRQAFLRPEWDRIKTTYMFWLVHNKFCDKELQNKLLDTGSDILIEGNTWGDTFWGMCNGEGQNNLGLILMDIRNAYRN